MDFLTQAMMFFQEWGPVIALLLFVALAMAADLFPKLASFMREVEQRYPQTLEYLNGQEQYVIDCYGRLPARIRAGFAVIGGKQAWVWLVKAGYAYLRRKQKNT
ncbi:hypothetical protein H7K32_15430 [Brevibacillus agri]|uniref:hypothetical protein n=1 Tax=Brevibacillus agri TaxID=51101 RepID=UPI001C8D919C|nr:hypothetical protein [Brevibacillus agri]MBY0053042.1 hypothetical protein [Brevibacillus agri]